MTNQTLTESTSDRKPGLTGIATALDALDDIVYVYDDDQLHWWNHCLEDKTGYMPEELAGLAPTDLFVPSYYTGEPEGTHHSADLAETTSVRDLVTTTGDRIPHEVHTTPWTDDATGNTYRCGVARDLRGRRTWAGYQECQCDELRTLTRITDLLRTIIRDLFTTSTRTALKQTVCTRLAESTLYQGAWIGLCDPDRQRLVPHASAGIDEDAIDTITLTTTETDTDHTLSRRALNADTIQVSQDVRTAPISDVYGDGGCDRGIYSAAAVPLRHGDTADGVLVVYTTRPLAFSHREQAEFETLGEAITFASDAIQNRNLLFADTVVELEFAVTDSDLVFVRASEQLGCDLTITGAVTSAAGEWSAYLAVDGATPTAVHNLMTDDSTVDETRIIVDADDSGLLECVMSGAVLPGLTDHGVMLTTGQITDGHGRFCIEIPRTTDVRRIAARLQAAYPASTVVAQREYDRPVQHAAEIRQSIEEELTAQQQEALTRAYHAGYFEWPRQCTGQDLAVAMDIAETTFHYHLRNALETLVAALTDIENG